MSRRERLPRFAAALGGFTLVLLGLWAMVGPEGFFTAIAMFEPYNRHFLQDLGAFQLGLGAVLLLAAFVTSDALAAGLIGVGIGAGAHVASHLAGLDLGGNPGFDLPGLSLLAALLLVAGVARLRAV
jgi:hypothetical protein